MEAYHGSFYHYCFKTLFHDSNHCGICYNICPQDVFSFDRKQKQVPAIAYPQECWYCGACVVDCATEAVSLQLPLPLHIVPSQALYGPPGKEESEVLKRAADFSRSVERNPVTRRSEEQQQENKALEDRG